MKKVSKYALTEQEKNALKGIDDKAVLQKMKHTIYHKKWRNDPHNIKGVLYKQWHGLDYQKNTLRHCVACDQTYRIDRIKVHLKTKKHRFNSELHNTNEVKKIAKNGNLQPNDVLPATSETFS